VSTDCTNEVEDSASHWLILRDSGRWTEADQASLEQWLEAATVNRITFLRLELAWEESARLKALGAGVAGDLPPPTGQWNLGPFFDRHRAGVYDAAASTTVSFTSPRRPWQLAIAASILIAVAVGSVAHYFTHGSERYTTPVGGMASVPMQDGSKITLNTDSQVRVAVTEAERRIDLKQGEAFFEVAKDPNRPFVVEVGGRRVVAVGTKFSVRRVGESVEVIVTEGKVRLEEGSAALQGNADDHAEYGAAKDVLLTAGTIAHAGEAGLLVERKSLAEAETQLSWRSGVLMFRELPLADAVAEFNRYNLRKIVIADPAVAALRVEGNFRPTNVEAFVRLLESGFPIRTTMDGDRLVLSSR